MYVRQEEYDLDTDSIRIRTPDPDYFRNLMGSTSSFKDTSAIKFSWKSDHSLRRYQPNYWKMPYLAMLKNPSKSSWIRRRVTSNLHRYTCGKIFVKIRSVVITALHCIHRGIGDFKAVRPSTRPSTRLSVRQAPALWRIVTTRKPQRKSSNITNRKSITSLIW